MPTLVMGAGPIDAKIVMIGEAPGSTEVRTGVPFTGSSGELLTKTMHNSGIPRGDVYFTNVVKEQPPGNDISHFIRFGNSKVYRTPAYDVYEEGLYKELEATSANVYVCIGNVSLYALTRLVDITKRRGSILQGTFHGRNVKVIPVIHPASALRNYIFTYFISYDMRRVREESAFPEIRLPSRSILLAPSFTDTMDFIAECRQSSAVAFDIEVWRHTQEISCFSMASTPYRGISIPLMSGGRDYFTPEQEAAVWKAVAGVMEDRNISKIFQNAAFDVSFIFTKYGIRTNSIEDTMIAMGIAFPDLPKGLDTISSIFTKEPYYKDDGKKYMKLGGSEENFWLYNAKDSLVCYESLLPLMSELERQGNMGTYRRQVLLVEPLVYMHYRGIKCDVEGLKRESAAADARIKELTAELHQLCGYAINPGSPKQLAEYFYIKKGLKPYISRTTHNWTTDATAMKRLSQKGHREATILLEISHLSTMKSRYFDMNIDLDGRMRCAFNPVGTTTGRLSSGKTIFDTGGNLQNQPPEMLQYMLAD